jgi:DNA polymerase III subunit gamma/tau
MLNETLPPKRCIVVGHWRRSKKKSDVSTKQETVSTPTENPTSPSPAVPVSTPEPVQPIAAPKPVVNKIVPETLSTPKISLKNIGKTPVPEKLKPKDEEIPDQNIVINEGTFQNLWNEFTQRLKDERNTNAYTVFSNTRPLRVEEGWLYIGYSNPLQESILLEARFDLQEFFAQKLDGLRIGIKTELIKEDVDPNKKVLYTDEDKLRYLSEKHPLVDDLKKRMGLDPNL